jgi:hypothetical protein
MGRPRKIVPNARPTRVPFDGYRNTLTFHDKDPDFHYRVFNDVENRIARAEAAGYEVVRSTEGLGDPTATSASPLGSAVTRPVGNNVTAVLMRIPRKWYDEDQAVKRRRNDEIEEALRAPPDGGYLKNLDIDRKR